MSFANLSFLSVLLAVPVLAQTLVDETECDCFLANDTRPTYSKSHRFWDFRSFSQFAKIETPTLDGTLFKHTYAPYLNAYFNLGTNSDFAQFWWVQNSRNGNETFSSQNSLNNVLRTARPSEDFQTSAEIGSEQYLDYVSLRVRSLTTGATGAFAEIFTARKRDDGVAEGVGIGMQTRDPSDILHYYNLPVCNETTQEAIRGSSFTSFLPNGKTRDTWHTYRPDWTPGWSTQFLDGRLAYETDFQSPTKLSQVFLNAWSLGNPEYSGIMTIGESAYQHVLWIELLYDITDESSCPRHDTEEEQKIFAVK